MGGKMNRSDPTVTDLRMALQLLPTPTAQMAGRRHRLDGTTYMSDGYSRNGTLTDAAIEVTRE